MVFMLNVIVQLKKKQNLNGDYNFTYSSKKHKSHYSKMSKMIVYSVYLSSETKTH